MCNFRSVFLVSIFLSATASFAESRSVKVCLAPRVENGWIEKFELEADQKSFKSAQPTFWVWVQADENLANEGLKLKWSQPGKSVASSRFPFDTNFFSSLSRSFSDKELGDWKLEITNPKNKVLATTGFTVSKIEGGYRVTVADQNFLKCASPASPNVPAAESAAPVAAAPVTSLAAAAAAAVGVTSGPTSTVPMVKAVPTSRALVAQPAMAASAGNPPASGPTKIENIRPKLSQLEADALPKFDEKKNRRLEVEVELRKDSADAPELLWLKLGEDQKFVTRLEASGLDQVRYQFLIPLKTKGLTIVSGDKGLINGNIEGMRAEFNYPHEINDRTNCSALEARDPSGAHSTYTLCTHIRDEEIAGLGFDYRAFYSRKQKGYWSQLSGGLAFQTISAPSASATSLGVQKSGVFRGSVGAWYEGWTAEVHGRAKVFSMSDQGLSPKWLDVFGGYKFELSPMNGVTPYVTLVAGAELYGNSIEAVNVRYLKNYLAYLAGTQLRFVFGSKLETGGDVIVGLADQVKKIFILGDLRYWWKKRDAVGAGYWIDLSSQSSISFSEKSAALEVYWRHVF